MLQVKEIRKQYKTGDLIQQALDGVSLAFRDNEFVAILGPSGSGKTTLLNIVGGLDRYDSGDLVINGVSTKDYKDRDWDTYRNHSIGFVFQSYNLISHQSVLRNVELALTISGISRAERKRRAKEALEKVGLGDQIHKKPNQMSGGQMQRVAIARALVNDPEILLADEPTGALDTGTGLQVMELLKEVAQDRLVIMVTHNPDLAEQYANRIVRLQDGSILDDSNPLVVEDKPTEKPKKVKKASMSFMTALSLSFNNLLTKKGRTLMTATAGSIGIIGIALILALSSGVNQYIEDLQKSTMTSYPITIQSSTLDLSSLLTVEVTVSGETMGAVEKDPQEVKEGIHSNSDTLLMTNTLSSSVVSNDLTAFKEYLEDPDSEIQQYIGENGVIYTYDVYFDVYATDEDGNYINTSRSLTDDSSSSAQFISIMTNNMSAAQSGDTSSMITFSSLMTGYDTASGAENFDEMESGTGDELISAVITDSYDVIYGAWPTSYDEVVLVIDEKNSIDTSVLCQLGLISEDDYQAIVDEVDEGAEHVDEITLDYADVVGTTFQMVTFSDYYVENSDGTFTDISSSYDDLYDALDNGVTLTIVGIVRQNDDASTSISAAVGYTSALTDYIIDHTNESAVILAQEADEETDVLTGRAFEETDDETKAAEAKEYLSELGVSDKASMFTMIMYYASSVEDADEEDVTDEDASDEDATETDEDATAVDYTALMDGSIDYSTLSEEELAALAATGADTTVDASAIDITSYADADESTLAAMLDAWLEGDADVELLALIYDSYLAGNTYDDNMSAFGKVSYDAPSSISIYCDSFEDKEMIAECIVRYNETVDEDEQITYTDYVALLTSAITTMVDIISYVLIAFVAVSLVVSCIMISIITQISVMERTKEIGILRAIGASKRNISQVFNAETFIIGICSGLIGVGLSEVLIIPINAVMHAVAGTDEVSAVLALNYAVILVVISIVITVISGLRPAKSAAKKDPVIALRTE